jgi:hypothetical protein
MKKLCFVLFLLFALSTVHGQEARTQSDPQKPAVVNSIEGYWQDIAGRTLFKRDVSPSATYGTWQSRDIGLPYYDVKHFWKSGAMYEMTDLRYGDDYLIKVISAKDDAIEFVRSPTWSKCRMHHKCQLNGDEMLCSLEQICQEAGKDILDWRGEERYAKRSYCERTDKEQALGIPTRCR